MTLRRRLVLYNAAALAGLLAAFAGGFAATNANRLRAELTDDLRRRGDEAAHGPARPRPPAPPPRLAGPGPDPYAESRRLADVRRPRFFDARGEGDVPLDREGLRAALGGRPRLTEPHGLLVYTVPLPEGGAVQVARETGDLRRLALAQGRALAILLPLGALVAALGAWLLARRALRPVRTMADAADALGASELARRLPAEGDDELAGLARTLNGMLARLERAFEDQRRFVADASHELRTPLARLRLAASAARERHPEDEGLASVERAARDLSDLAQSLLTLAKADATGLGLRLEPADLRVVVAEALGDAPVVADFPEGPVPVLADAASLGRAVANLVDNALRHTAPPGRVLVSVKPIREVVVRDEGEGIAPADLPRVFDRFYRADSARGKGGTGLGLALVRAIVEAHGGTVRVESGLGEGATFRLLLPDPGASRNPHERPVS